MVRTKGNFKITRKYLKNIADLDYVNILTRYGEKGVNRLRAYTPKDSSETADAWGYKIVDENGKIGLQFTNSNTVDGIPVVILLQFGHATHHRGYVQGRDFINPAIQPIFDELASEIWREVVRS